MIEERAIPTIFADDKIELAVVLLSGGKFSARILNVNGVTAALKPYDTTFRIINKAKESARPYVNWNPLKIPKTPSIISLVFPYLAAYPATRPKMAVGIV